MREGKFFKERFFPSCTLPFPTLFKRALIQLVYQLDQCALENSTQKQDKNARITFPILIAAQRSHSVRLLNCRAVGCDLILPCPVSGPISDCRFHHQQRAREFVFEIDSRFEHCTCLHRKKTSQERFQLFYRFSLRLNRLTSA